MIVRLTNIRIDRLRPKSTQDEKDLWFWSLPSDRFEWDHKINNNVQKMISICGSHYERGLKSNDRWTLLFARTSVFTKIAEWKVPDEDYSSHVLLSSQRSQNAKCQMKITLRTFFFLRKDRREERIWNRPTRLRFFSLSSTRFFKTLTSLYTVGLEREERK